MIKSYLGLVIIFAVQHQVCSLSAEVEQRVKNAHRKDRTKRLQGIQKRSEIIQDPIDNYDLIVTEASETTLTEPVLRYRHRRHRHRSGNGANLTIKHYNPNIPLKDINTPRKNFNLTGATIMKQIQEDKDATTTNYFNKNRRGEEVATTRTHETKEATSQNPVKKNQNVTAVLPFYRRLNYLMDQERNKPQKWVHCLDLITPRLKGYKDDWRPKEVHRNHGDVKRITELLKTDVSLYTEDEIISVLYQISTIDFRIFQWDYTAVTQVLNVITKGTKHDFRTLKAGVKGLFEQWHLDTSKLRTFLDQTRIIRPPCIDITGYTGYTKKGGGVLYTKPDKPTKKHKGSDESCRS